MKTLEQYLGIDYGELKAREFEYFIAGILRKSGKVDTQVKVLNRYDGRPGKVDLVLYENGEKIGIEIDWKSPRKKSIFKLHQLNANKMFVFLRSPFQIIPIQ